MFCVNCGKQLEESARFCPYCGTAVNAGSAGAPQQNAFYPDHQTGGTGGRESDASGHFGGFDPWSVKAASRPGTEAVNSGGVGGVNPKPCGDDPWGRANGPVYAAPARAEKKWRPAKVGLVIIAVILGVFVAGFALLAFIGARIPDYELVLSDYFSYAENDDVQGIRTLYVPEVYESCVEYAGEENAMDILDSWTKYYGLEFDYYDVADETDCTDQLDDFNEAFGVSATDYRNVTVDAYYKNGVYNCLDFDFVEIGDSWYLVRTW